MSTNSTTGSETLADLGESAWEARRCAHLHGPTAVGAAVLSTNSRIHQGCNVEHRFRSHDVHAEVNALTNMVVSDPGALADIIVIAAAVDK